MAAKTGRKPAPKGRKNTTKKTTKRKTSQDRIDAKVRDEVVLLITLAIAILLFDRQPRGYLKQVHVWIVWLACIFCSDSFISGNYIRCCQSWQSCRNNQIKCICIIVYYIRYSGSNDLRS